MLQSKSSRANFSKRSRRVCGEFQADQITLFFDRIGSFDHLVCVVSTPLSGKMLSCYASGLDWWRCSPPRLPKRRPCRQQRSIRRPILGPNHSRTICSPEETHKGIGVHYVCRLSDLPLPSLIQQESRTVSPSVLSSVSHNQVGRS
jgi:hypothetical protein